VTKVTLITLFFHVTFFVQKTAVHLLTMR